MKNGTPILWQRVLGIPLSRLLTLLLVCAGLMTGTVARSQCTGGLNPVQLNWDILDAFTTQTNYTDDNYINPTSLAYQQHFAFGHNNRLSINVNTNITLGGDVNTHTGDIANYTGDDVMYTPTANGQTITLTFGAAVNNLNFTLYDIERGQSLTITAVNGPLPVGVNVATYAGTILTVAGLPVLRSVTANNTTIAQNVNTGSATITFAGAVTSVQILISQQGSQDRDLYLSDINACMAGTFPVNYYAVAQPFTGQPGYVLHAFNRSVYYVNPANGFTRLLFTDPTPAANNVGNINSLAYDPYNRWIYFVYSLTSDGNTTTLKKYDVNTGVVSTVLADLETIGIPTANTTGTESGSASFYNGSYYIGVETGDGGRSSNREAVIWRVDFNGANVPFRASQVFSQPIDNGGGLLLHDWSDFVIYDGILYNFDAAQNDNNGTPAVDRNQSDIYHVNMMTGATTRFTKPGAAAIPVWYPGQPAINWAGQVVQMYAQGNSPNTPQGQPQAIPYISLYNGAGGIGARFNLFSTPMFTPATPSLGDAGEAFRPRSDFGDAPASFDPVPLGVATHEVDPLIRLGASVINEWNGTPSALANAEGAEENGIGAAPTLNYDATLTYTVNNIQVFNNTGVQARVVAWLDFNFDGVWQASEGRASGLINSSASMQSVNLTWTNIFVPMTSNLRTYLRIRVSRNSNGLTTNTMNGWFSDGEVEDYPVVLGVALPKDIQSFNVKKQTNATVDVKWSINVQQQVESYDILRSSDNGDNWTAIGTVSARNGFGLQNYTFNDLTPAAGTSYYRIRINYQAAGSNKLSEVRSVKFDVNNGFIRILPNPAHETAELQISSARKDEAVIRVYDRSGRMVMNLKQGVDAGMNSIRINNLSKLSDGVYTIRTIVNGRTTSNQLIIKKQ